MIGIVARDTTRAGTPVRTRPAAGRTDRPGRQRPRCASPVAGPSAVAVGRPIRVRGEQRGGASGLAPHHGRFRCRSSSTAIAWEEVSARGAGLPAGPDLVRHPRSREVGCNSRCNARYTPAANHPDNPSAPYESNPSSLAGVDPAGSVGTANRRGERRSVGPGCAPGGGCRWTWARPAGWRGAKGWGWATAGGGVVACPGGVGLPRVLALPDFVMGKPVTWSFRGLGKRLGMPW